MRPKQLYVFGFLMAFFSLNTYAEVEEEITVVGTRTERSINDLASTINVISSERIEEELSRDIADLIRFEPGVSVGGTGSRFGLSGFSIRGIGENRVLTLVDGIRIPDECQMIFLFLFVARCCRSSLSAMRRAATLR